MGLQKRERYCVFIGQVKNHTETCGQCAAIDHAQVDAWNAAMEEAAKVALLWDAAPAVKFFVKELADKFRGLRLPDPCGGNHGRRDENGKGSGRERSRH